MKTLLALIGLCLLTLNLSAQVLEPITIDESGHYTQNDVRLNVKTILNIVEPNVVAYQEVKRGKSRRTWGYVLSGTSGAFTSMAILEEEDRGAAIAAACLSFGGGVILLISGSRRIAKGVNIYNSSLNSSSTSDSGSINLGLTNNGVGITFTF